MPRYTQFPRSNVAGNVPTRIDAGSFAVNWADRKIYTGGPNGEPLLMSYRLSDHDEARGYREQDIVYRDGSLWRCDVAFATGPFNPQQWLELTDINTAPYKELSGTVLITGGGLSISGSDILVSGGTGVVMNLSTPHNPIISPVMWGASELIGPFALNTQTFVGVDGNGALTTIAIDDPDATVEWRRNHIVIGSFTTDEVGVPVKANTQSITQHQTRETLSDVLSVLGPFKVEGVTINLSAPSELRVAAGEVFWHGLRPFTNSPNIVDVATMQPFPVFQASRNGYETDTLAGALDVASWDNGGVLTAVPPDTWTTQFIFLSTSLVDGIAVYGQKTYGSLDTALADVTAAWEELERPAITSNMILLGAIVSDAAGTSQSVINTDEGFGDPFGGGGGGGDTSQFLLISGERAMTGNLDLGGNGIENGIIDGQDVALVPEQTDATGAQTGVAPVDGELYINTTDKKVFTDNAGTPVAVADRIEVYDETRQYVAGDKTIQSNNLYLCTEPLVGPEPFDPAKWQLVGADNSGALGQAVIIQPDSADRNTIDLTGQGGVVAALKTNFDNGQSVPTYEFSPNAQISRFGIPTGAFGEDVFRVSQVNHLFTAVGTPVYFSGTQWLGADVNDPARFPQAVVHEIIDTDNFLLQIGGRINGLDPAAFVGGVAPVAGEFYYASDQAGLLTNVQGPTPVPVLYAISSTTALVKLTGTRIPLTLTPTDIVDIVYPVGSTYITIDPADPSLRWPGTTWVADGQGRAIVGVGNNGESDWTVEQERGSETHTLTEDELPAHSHASTLSGTATAEDFNKDFDFRIRSKSGSSMAGGGENVTVIARGGPNNASQVEVNNPQTNYDRIEWDMNHGHNIDYSDLNIDQSDVGGDQPHDNVQPSKAFYIWRRTA